MKRLGIDVKRAFEQLVSTSIDLNYDDIPEDPEVGGLVEEEINKEMDRMCNDDAVKLSKKFDRVYRVRSGLDKPALVEALVVTIVKGAEPYRRKPRRIPPSQIYLYVGQLL
ncbi:hypothetical protein GN244_ATG11199 [Phytophthora infestans]|uniref:Uncharacterized protein n=1 Tax=Phytophthora infestans TaxID=4787 RepID=A0A833T035_PHYIN|nr:hypothetical protein GN244_ATG11199 [Phytophthora infestans]